MLPIRLRIALHACGALTLTERPFIFSARVRLMNALGARGGVRDELSERSDTSRKRVQKTRAFLIIVFHMQLLF